MLRIESSGGCFTEGDENSAAMLGGGELLTSLSLKVPRPDVSRSVVLLETEERTSGGGSGDATSTCMRPKAEQHFIPC